jgi:hypothetical protein
MHTETLLLLNLGQAYVETSWGQAPPATTAGPIPRLPAGCFCLLTGVAEAMKVSKGLIEQRRTEAFDALYAALPDEARDEHETRIHNIARYNDVPGRTKEEVIAVFLRAKEANA